MHIRNISHFEGLQTEGLGRGKASLFTLLDAMNIRTHQGEAKPRPGQVYLTDEDHKLPAAIHSIYQYSRDGQSGSDWIIYREYIVSATLDFSEVINYYGWDGDLDNTIDRINETGAGVRIPLTSDDMWAAEYKDWMWLVNGEDAMYKYDGLNFYRAGIVGPENRPTVTLSVTDVFAGATGKWRKYKYRYIRLNQDITQVYEYGASPLSDETVFEFTDDFGADVSIVASTDEQVDAIEIYATELKDTQVELDGATFYRLDEQASITTDFGVGYKGVANATADFLDVITNLKMTGVSYIDNDRPDLYSWFHPELDTANDWTNPLDKLLYLTVYKDRLYAVHRDNRSVPLYSDLGEPESWNGLNFLDVRREDGDFVTGFASRGVSLYIFKSRSIWVMTGDPDASPTLQPLTGGERIATQTEFGLGCTAPRSIATYGEDIIIFYSSYYGVYLVSGQQVNHLSAGIDMSGLDDASAGLIYADNNGDLFYVLSPPTGDAWVYQFKNKGWVKDNNVNVSSFCIDHNGAILAGSEGFINQLYDEDEGTDNGDQYQCHFRTAWVNLRNANEDAVIRKVQTQTKDMYDNCTLEIFDENNHNYVTTFTQSDRWVGINTISGRLFSVAYTWIRGTIESLTFHFIRRRGH